MKKSLLFGLIMVLLLNLCACMGSDIQSHEENHHQPTAEPTTEPVTTHQTAESTTAPAHSPLYLPEHTPDQIGDYFEEIVFQMEYSDGTGNTGLVQKWLSPMNYYIYGDATDEDLAVLTGLFEQLNEIDGFPGIYPTDNRGDENLSISFLDEDAFFGEFSECINGEDAYGATQFWYYTDTNEIHTAKVGYRTDLDQDTRTSVIMEEIVNMLGVSDTVLRENSVVYQYSNDNMALSDVDWVILKLLYSSEIACGMNAESCRPILLELYY